MNFFLDRLNGKVIINSHTQVEVSGSTSVMVFGLTITTFLPVELRHVDIRIHF